MTASAPRLPLILGAGCILAVAVATRLPSFAFSVLDWDESLYFLMASQWRAGHLPYTTLWDNKPIGLYALFVATQAVSGASIAGMRAGSLLATLAVAALLWRLAWRLLGPVPWRGLCAPLAGLLFVLASVPDDGLAANAELFMEVVVCAGALLLARPQPPRRPGGARAAAAGLCFGAACMIKYVAVCDAAALALALLALAPRPARAWAAPAAAFCAGLLLPFLAALTLYWWHGRLGVFLADSLLSYLRRGAVPFSLATWTEAFARQALLGPWLWLAPLLLAWRAARGHDRAIATLLLAWTLGSALGATAGGFYYSHYFLQVLPPLCLCAGLMAARLAGSPAAGAAVVALAVLPSAGAAGTTLADMLPTLRLPPALGLLRDPPAQIARDLRPELAPGQTVYVFDAQPILYALLRVTPPTRYVLPSFLTSRFMTGVSGADPLAELHAVLARQPTFVIRARAAPALSQQARDQRLYCALDAALAAGYRPWRLYPGTAVYRRRDDATEIDLRRRCPA